MDIGLEKFQTSDFAVMKFFKKSISIGKVSRIEVNSAPKSSFIRYNKLSESEESYIGANNSYYAGIIHCSPVPINFKKFYCLSPFSQVVNLDFVHTLDYIWTTPKGRPI